MIKAVSRRLFVQGLGLGLCAPAFALPRTAAAADAGPPPLSAYGRLPAVSDVAISPDGTRVTFLTTRNNERLIIDYELATKKAAAAAIEGDKFRDLMWVDNSHVFLLTSMTQRDVGETYEQWFGLILDIPAGKKGQIYYNIPGIYSSAVTGEIHRVRINGQYRVTAGNRQAPEGINMVNSDGQANSYTENLNSCLYAFDPASIHGLRLDTDPGDVQSWALRYDTGAVVGRSSYDDRTKLWLLEINGPKGWSRVMSVPSRYDAPNLEGLGRDPQSLLVRKAAGADYGRYFEVDYNGKETAVDLPDPGYYPIFLRGTGALAGFGREGPIKNYVLFDPVLKKLPDMIDQALPDSVNTLVDFAEDARKVIVYSEGKGDSGSFYFIDFTTGDAVSLGSVYPDLPGDWIAERQWITYPAADGLEIKAWLTLPRGEARNRALVVLPHGGPQAHDERGFDWMSQALASRGYVVLQPQYRGSDGFGETLVSAGYGEFGRKMQTDLSDGVRHLVKTGVADPKRVAIAGASYGGYAAMAGVTIDKGVYNCAVAISGLSDLKAYLAYVRERSNANSKSYAMEYWHRFMGPDAGLDTVSPIRHVAEVGVPVLLIHGKDDTVVPFDQSQVFYDALTKAGKPAEFVQLKQEDHWLSREATRVECLDAMTAFLLKNNPPV
jgi:dipeptidyl aminopeptidase/acylaminoacyl peptidase